jgi:general secretion pathway protein C
MSRSSTFGHSGFLTEGPLSSTQAPRRAPAVLAGVLWLAAGLSAGYWALQALSQGRVTPLVASAAPLQAPEPSTVARALGAMPAAPVAAAGVAPVVDAASRYRLIGVVASGTDRGAALISVDGQPPKPYRVGAALEGGLVLKSLGARQARLAPTSGAGNPIDLALPPPNPS